jgi:hypothetical protein
MMKLGRDTGSLINHVMSFAASGKPAPVVGMGATVLMWTDRHAATIVEVSANGKRVGIREDIATRTDANGMSESQTYSYAPNEAAAVEYYSLRKNGRYVRVGSSINGTGLLIGDRRQYRDFGF